jgi:hypothetical protein
MFQSNFEDNDRNKSESYIIRSTVTLKPVNSFQIPSMTQFIKSWVSAKKSPGTYKTILMLIVTKNVLIEELRYIIYTHLFHSY